MSNLQYIPLTDIHASPYQHRKHFGEAKLNELAKSIERDGLIEPIVIRRNAAGYELIAGERRWRAAQRTSADTILARIVEATDLQARRMCAAENLQRQDLSDVEAVFAIIELIDAEMADDPTYSAQGNGTPIDRVGWLLGKLNADYANGTEHFIHKFMYKVERIFDGLPKPIEWRSFYNNDFRPLTTISEDVKETAIANQLNKSQTKALDSLKKEAPEAFDRLTQDADEDGRVTVAPLPFDMNEERPALRELSARDIRGAAWSVPSRGLIVDAPREIVLGTYDGDEWYTPQAFIDAARTLMGGIDVDPATCAAAQKVINAETPYTKDDDGLAREWRGRVWCNPPYSYPLIERFTQKAIAEYDAKRITDGLMLVNNCTDAAWFVAMAERFPVMFTKGRARFWQEDQRTFATRQGQAIFYLGTDADRFRACFAHLAYAPIGRGA